MVKLSQRVLKRWRELSADSYKVRIELLFTSRLDPTAATEVLSQSLRRVLQDFEATHGDVPPEVEEPFAGEWDVAPVPEGALLVGGYKSDAFEEVFQAIVDDLSQNEVRGKLDLYTLPEVPSLPATIGVVEARVRVLGRRVVDRRDRWAADRAALHRVLAAATRWCLQARPRPRRHPAGWRDAGSAGAPLRLSLRAAARRHGRFRTGDAAQRRT